MYIHEASRHYSNPGFLFAILVRQIELGEGVATRFRLSGQLDEKGREEELDILLVKIPKVKIKVRHRCQSRLP